MAEHRYQSWMRYFTPGPVHHRLGLVCLGVGMQHGALPPVGPRTLDHHVAVVISGGRGWYTDPGDPQGPRHEVVAPALLWLTPGARRGTPAPVRGADRPGRNGAGHCVPVRRRPGTASVPVPLRPGTAARIRRRGRTPQTVAADG